MRLSRSVAALLGVLVLLIAASAFLWLWVGTGRAEVDPRIANTLQNFTCSNSKCGHNFALTMAEVSRMRRLHGQICCPKCGEGGALKDLTNRSSAGPVPSANKAPSDAEPVKPNPTATLAPAGAAPQAPKAKPVPASAPSAESGDAPRTPSG